jgi:hypothetical protein
MFLYFVNRVGEMNVLNGILLRMKTLLSCISLAIQFGSLT